MSIIDDIRQRISNAILPSAKRLQRPYGSRGYKQSTSIPTGNELTMSLRGTVFACLPSPQVSREVALGASGIGKNLPDLKIYIEASTIGTSTVKEITHGLKQQGISLLDAPVSGGPRGARGAPCGGQPSPRSGRRARAQWRDRRRGRG